MGLWVSHDCFNGSYGAFNRWRDKLAEVAGYGFLPLDYGRKTPDVDWDKLAPHEFSPTLNGEWDGIEVQEDPLVYLIVHYDCDGFIYPQQAEPLANRLEELLDKLPQDGSIGTSGSYINRGHDDSFYRDTEQFIKGLRLAVENNERVVFS